MPKPIEHAVKLTPKLSTLLHGIMEACAAFPTDKVENLPYRSPKAASLLLQSLVLQLKTVCATVAGVKEELILEAFDVARRILVQFEAEIQLMENDRDCHPDVLVSSGILKQGEIDDLLGKKDPEGQEKPPCG